MTERIEKERLLIEVFYEGPWERVMNWLLGIDPRTNELRWEVSDGSVLDRLSQMAENRHHRWINRYAARGQNPPDRWKRRVR